MPISIDEDGQHKEIFKGPTDKATSRMITTATSEIEPTQEELIKHFCSIQLEDPLVLLTSRRRASVDGGDLYSIPSESQAKKTAGFLNEFPSRIVSRPKPTGEPMAFYDFLSISPTQKFPSSTLPPYGYSLPRHSSVCGNPTLSATGCTDKRIALYKTEMCRTFEETGTCRYGIKCQFAHDPSELRKVPRHPRYKTEICKTFWQLGNCPYGKRCCFIHTENELRAGEGSSKVLGNGKSTDIPTGSSLPVFTAFAEYYSSSSRKLSGEEVSPIKHLPRYHRRPSDPLFESLSLHSGSEDDEVPSSSPRTAKVTIPIRF